MKQFLKINDVNQVNDLCKIYLILALLFVSINNKGQTILYGNIESYRYSVPQNIINIEKTDENFILGLASYVSYLVDSTPTRCSYLLYYSLKHFQESNDPRAKRFINQLNQNGYILPPHGYTEELKKQAKSGKPKAILDLGKCYYFGYKYFKSFKELDKSSEKSMKLYNQLYYDIWNQAVREKDKTGVPISSELRSICSEAGFLIGLAKAVVLADYYDNIQSYNQTQLNAKKLILEAGQSGITPAMWAYSGYCNNDDRKIEWLKAAAENGDRLSQRKLSNIYFRRDSSEHMKYLIMAADNNDPISQYEIGEFYFEKKEYKKALSYLSLASDATIDKAPAIIGQMYEEGYGVEKDLKAAIFYYRLSLNRGYGYANYFLGHALFLNKQYDEAFEYLNKAAHGVYWNAKDKASDEKIRNINSMLNSNPMLKSVIKHDLPVGIGVIKIPEAMRMLSTYYMLKDDPQKSKYWLEEAGKHKDVTALELLKMTQE